MRLLLTFLLFAALEAAALGYAVGAYQRMQESKRRQAYLREALEAYKRDGSIRRLRHYAPR